MTPINSLVRLLKFPSLRPFELWAALPAVALLLPVLLSAGFPETLERTFTVGVGPFGLFIPFGVGYLALPLVFFRVGCFDRRLFAFAVFFLLAGIASAVYGSLPSAGLFYGFCLFGTFALASKLSWTEREFRFLFWIPLMVVAGLGLQIVLLSLGFVSFSVDSGFGTLGVEGEISRISTTAGAATGTAPIIFVCGFLSAFAYLQLFRNRLYWFLIIGITGGLILLTFTRGSVLIYASFMIGILFIPSRTVRVPFAVKAVSVAFIFGTHGLLMFKNADILSNLVTRGFGDYAETSFFADNGRFIRYLDALAYWQDNVLAGSGLGGYYHRAKWLRFYPGLAEGHTSPHNVYLLVLAECGILAFVLFLIILFGFAVQAFRMRNFFLLSGLLSILLVGMNLELIYLEGVLLNLFAICLSLTGAMQHDRPLNTFESLRR